LGGCGRSPDRATAGTVRRPARASLPRFIEMIPKEDRVKGQIESLLERGIEAARVDENKRARDFFLHIIELDQRNERAWLWLSSVVETPVDREICLENVLLINPDNTYAAMGLRHLRQKLSDEPTSYSSVLPRLATHKSGAKRKRGASTAEASPPPAERVCSKCGFRNPGWAYLCDRCGANLRRVDLHDALEPRGSGFFTLIEAWFGAFTFNRVWAFKPELELASWGRSLAALVLAALFTAAWRAAMSLLLWKLTSDGQWETQIGVNALQGAVQTLPPALLLALACVPIALLTWIVALLVGGQQDFQTHFHLTAVAFSAWIVLTALLTPLTLLTPYVLRGDPQFGLPFDVVTKIVAIVVSTAGPMWLIQAVRTAQDLSFVRAILTTLLVALLSAALFFSLELLTGGAFADLLSKLVVSPFLPLPDLGV